MRFSDRTMVDQDKEISGSGIERSARNDWAKSIEPLVRQLAPLPISYDIDSTQPLDFTEYSYTEFLGGIYINTQSVEINTRIIKLASEIPYKVNNLSKLVGNKDKYKLKNVKAKSYPPKVAFMVGHNMFDLVSPEVMARAAFENPDFFVKLHPLTNQEYAGKVAGFVGWDRIIGSEYSGVDFLTNCQEAYVSTATELCSLAVAMGKKIRNISSFFHESSGVYYPINSLLFRSDQPQETLANILDCEFSGLIFPWTKDPEQKIINYFNKTLELRELYRPLSSKSKLIKQS